MKIVGFFFRLYHRLFSPAIQVAFGIQCRYDETCSRYTERMIQEKGFFRGAALGVRRILSCNKFEWSKHG